MFSIFTSSKPSTAGASEKAEHSDPLSHDAEGSMLSTDSDDTNTISGSDSEWDKMDQEVEEFEAAAKHQKKLANAAKNFSDPMAAAETVDVKDAVIFDLEKQREVQNNKISVLYTTISDLMDDDEKNKEEIVQLKTKEQELITEKAMMMEQLNLLSLVKDQDLENHIQEKDTEINGLHVEISVLLEECRQSQKQIEKLEMAGKDMLAHQHSIEEQLETANKKNRDLSIQIKDKNKEIAHLDALAGDLYKKTRETDTELREMQAFLQAYQSSTERQLDDSASTIAKQSQTISHQDEQLTGVYDTLADMEEESANKDDQVSALGKEQVKLMGVNKNLEKEISGLHRSISNLLNQTYKYEEEFLKLKAAKDLLIIDKKHLEIQLELAKQKNKEQMETFSERIRMVGNVLVIEKSKHALSESFHEALSGLSNACLINDTIYNVETNSLTPILTDQMVNNFIHAIKSKLEILESTLNIGPPAQWIYFRDLHARAEVIMSRLQTVSNEDDAAMVKEISGAIKARCDEFVTDVLGQTTYIMQKTGKAKMDAKKPFKFPLVGKVASLGSSFGQTLGAVVQRVTTTTPQVLQQVGHELCEDLVVGMDALAEGMDYLVYDDEARKRDENAFSSLPEHEEEEKGSESPDSFDGVWTPQGSDEDDYEDVDEDDRLLGPWITKQKY